LHIAQNINKKWQSEDIETKKRVQELVFPDGVSLDMSERQYLTTNINLIFEMNRAIARVSEGSKNKRPTKKIGGSSLVASITTISNHRLVNDLLAISRFYYYIKGKSVSRQK
jgi:hypothetical protein